jgi:hypothetical protein
MIKVLIAVESRFKLRADPKVKHSTAFGLMQVTGTTRDDLKGKRKKDHVLLRDYYLDLEKEDLADAVVSIAAGIRWLSYKFTSIRNMQKRSWTFIILLLNRIAFAADEIDPVVKTFIHKYHLKIPDGREVVISQPGKKSDDITMKRVFLRKKANVLWDKTFGTGDDNLIWWDAHFMPVVSGKFIDDIDNDGIQEIAAVVAGADGKKTIFYQYSDFLSRARGCKQGLFISEQGEILDLKIHTPSRGAGMATINQEVFKLNCSI